MIHTPESKLHSLPTTSPPFLLIRPSTTRHSPNLTNQVVLPFSNETSSRIFLASSHPAKPRSPAFPSPSKALSSFNKVLKDKYSPSNRTMTPNRNSGIIDEENTNVPLKISLQEVKDEQGNGHVRFIRKPEKNGFRALLNKYRQDNDGYPNILQSKTLEGDAIDFKLSSGRPTPTARSIIAKMLRKREEEVQETLKESSAEAAYNKAIKEAITNALPKRAPVVSHNRTRSVQIDTLQSPSKSQNLQNVPSNRPKTPAKIRVMLPIKQVRAQTATADDIKNMIEVSGLLQADRKLDSEQNEKRQYYLNKVPLLKELNIFEAESHLHNKYTKRPRSKAKPHPFAMSLSYTQSPMGSVKDKLSSNGFERWSVIGSTKQIEQTRASMESQKKQRTTVTNGLMNLSAIKEWMDVLTVKGNVVTPSQAQDVVFEGTTYTAENREVHTQKSLCSSSRRQKAEDKVRNQPEIKITRFSMTPKPRREDIKKEVKQVVLAQRKKSADIVEKVVKGVVVLPKKMSFSLETREKSEKKKEENWQDNLSNVGLDGWEVSPTHENFDKICLDERVDTVQSKTDDLQTEEL